MKYISSMEYGRQPFVPDKTRGHWASVSDFLCISIALGFKMDLSTFGWFFLFDEGIIGIIPYMISLCIFVVPLLVIQSFLGQFSSSGYISALRVSPFFKGIGYISLVLNFCVLTYYSIYASTPLFYFLNSLRPTLPWSCEGMTAWANNATNSSQNHLCNETFISTLNTSSNGEYDPDEFISVKIPSVMYYRMQYNVDSYFFFEQRNQKNVHTPWQLIGCTFLIWAAIAYIFHTFRQTEKLGQLIRFMTWTTFSLMMICLTRFLFLPSTQLTLAHFFRYDWSIGEVLIIAPVHALQIFGPGWGAMLSVASFNKFKTDIGRQSWLICLGQLFILFAIGLMSELIDGHLSESVNGEDTMGYLENSWSIFLGSGSALAKLSLPNLWSLLYFGMLTLASTIIMVIQAHSFFTAIFDEFVYLRQRKMEVIYGLIGLWFLLSLHTCSIVGIVFHVLMSLDIMVVQVSFHLLILLIVLWVYGCERFQRDIQFMLGYTFPTWKVYMMRFVAPLVLLIILLKVTEDCYIYHSFAMDLIAWVSLLCLVLPWLLIPINIGYILMQSTGPIYTRWKKVCQPTDWYPVEREDRQRYEEAYPDANSDGATQQLDEVVDTSVFP